MSFVRELLDVNIKKEMSEEVKDFKANVSNISGFEYEGYTGRQDDMKQYMHMCLDVSFVFRYLVVVQVPEVWIAKGP